MARKRTSGPICAVAAESKFAVIGVHEAGDDAADARRAVVMRAEAVGLRFCVCRGGRDGGSE